MKKLDPDNLDITSLKNESRYFFTTFGTPKILGMEFIEDMDCCNSGDLFEKLIEKCGYTKDFKGFFTALFSKIYTRKKNPARINGKDLPLLFVYHLLDKAFPANRLHAVTTVSQLEEKAFITPENPSKLKKVMEMFPVRLSDHVIRQALVSDAVAKQYLPFADELDDTGHIITFDGHFKNGVVEQMYQNRVIFLLDMNCPVYCRFCFRKHKSKRKEKSPGRVDVEAAIDHVKSHPAINEILITGGEPLWNKTNMEIALNGLMNIDHVNAIRIATRSIFYYPQLFLKDNGKYIQYLIEKNTQSLEYGKRIEIGIHVVHPDEISIQSLDIISRLVKNGIQVYVQTPFLGGLNTDGKILARLFAILRLAGAQIYYIFAPCSPIHGTKEYWSTINKAFAAQHYLRKNLSDRCVPKLCTATSLGKIEWNTSGWAVEPDEENPGFTWIRTPYTLEYFRQFVKDPEEMPDMRVNDEGTLDAKYRLEMGEDYLICGKRTSAPREKVQRTSPEPIKDINEFLSILYDTPGLGPSVCKLSGQMLPDLMARVHKTRLEIKAVKMINQGTGDALFNGCLDYIAKNKEITDIVLHWDDSPDSSLDEMGKIVKKLKEFSHIVSIRLRSGMLCTFPEMFTPDIIEIISQWSDFGPGSPFRIEMETWFLLADQITQKHHRAAKEFINRGINIYANGALIYGINDDPDAITDLAHALRKAKIEFHHFYTAGLDIQKRATQKKQGRFADHQRVIDIASRVRAQCSGRQIPLYMVQTPDGDIDFGLDPSFIPFSP